MRIIVGKALVHGNTGISRRYDISCAVLISTVFAAFV